MFLPRYLIALLSQRSHPSARRNSVKSYNVNTIALQESFHLKKRKKEKRNTQNSLLHNSGGKIERKKDTHITGSHYVVTALLLMLYHLSYHYTSNYKKKDNHTRLWPWTDLELSTANFLHIPTLPSYWWNIKPKSASVIQIGLNRTQSPKSA